MLKIAYASCYAHPLPENHRFPMIKYELLPEQLIREGSVQDENFFVPEEMNEEMILTIHDAEYWHKLKSQNLSKKEERRTGFPLSDLLVYRERVINQGTVECAKYALKYGVAMNIAGGTHHAFTNRGEGFCLLNDIALAAAFLLEKTTISKILVVDLDVHQGNGTAQIFQNDPRVFTFSMHGANNYPLEKEKSDLDVGLADKTEDNFYLKTLDTNLKNLIDIVQPQFIFFQSGVDILETDKLGRLAVTREGCKKRDELVLKTAKSNNIPIVASMGGGYSEDLKEIIEAHANTYRLAQEIFF